MKHILSTAMTIISMALHSSSARAADQSPLDFSLRQYAFLLATALLGGLVSWYAKVKSGTVQAWNLLALVGELATSAFAGLLAFWLCAWAGSPELVTAALVGVAGHMGARAIAAFEDWAQNRFGAGGPGRPPTGRDGGQS